MEDGLCWLCWAEQGQSCCRVVVTFPVFYDQECDHLIHEDVNDVPAFNKLLGLERWIDIKIMNIYVHVSTRRGKDSHTKNVLKMCGSDWSRQSVGDPTFGGLRNRELTERHIKKLIRLDCFEHNRKERKVYAKLSVEDVPACLYEPMWVYFVW